MKLAELKLLEADPADTPAKIELKDVVDYFPGNHAKAIRKLWGTDRLTYRGMQFFDKGGIGEAYDKALAAIEEWYKTGEDTVEIALGIGNHPSIDKDEFIYNSTIAEVQECYVGYRPADDSLYVGVDAWLDENDFNAAWDEFIENATGAEYDEGDEEQSAAFDEAWRNYTAMGGYGILFEITFNGDKAEVRVELESQGGFYGGVRKLSAFKHLGLVDIRLD